MFVLWAYLIYYGAGAVFALVYHNRHKIRQAFLEAAGWDGVRPKYRIGMDKAAQVLVRDRTIGRELLALTGKGDLSMEDALQNREILYDVVRRSRRNYLLDILYLAATQDEISFGEVSGEKGFAVVNYPTNKFDFRPITELGELPDARGEDLMAPDELFYARLAESELYVPEYYEAMYGKKILFVLIDGSGSMETVMSSGLPRHVWARGVMINLLMRAMEEDVHFIIRYFSDTLDENVYEAKNREQAAELIKLFVRQGKFSGGTDILLAVSAAAARIREIRETGTAAADIFLISDGEDNSTAAQLYQELGGDINLHSAIIETDNRVLRQVSTHYYQIRG